MDYARLGSADLLWPAFSLCTYETSAENNFLTEQTNLPLIMFLLSTKF